MLDKGGQWGLIAEEHLKDAEDRSVNQLAAPYSPERMIYGVRGAGGTNIGGERVMEDAITKWTSDLASAHA